MFTRALAGLVLAVGGVFLGVVLFGSVPRNLMAAIVVTAVVVSLLGTRLPGLNGFVIGVIAGGLVGTVWLEVAVTNGTPVPAAILPPELVPPELLEPELLPVYLVVPAVTFGLAGFVLGRRVGPVIVLVLGGLVAGGTVLLPTSIDRLAIVTAIVAAPVIIAILAAIGTDARLPSGQAE